MLLNCDMGESFGAWQMGNDAAVMPYIDMANIACGFHAGSPAIMAETVALAKQHQVLIGAHPAYPDLEGFGRRSMSFQQSELAAILTYQIGAMEAICAQQGETLAYVKPHGALYNDKQSQPHLFETVVQVLAERNRHRQQPLRLMTLAPLVSTANTAATWQQQLAHRYRVPLWFEAFADRRYEANGQLRARRHADAVLQTSAEILSQAQALAQQHPINASDGSSIQLQADTLCVHGDNAESIATVAAIRKALTEVTRSTTGTTAVKPQ